MDGCSLNTFPIMSASLLQLSNRVLNLAHPHVMGILNITPDSFSDGGELHGEQLDVTLQRVQQRAAAMLEEGVSLLDVGGESTRPGAAEVSVDEELRRVVPVIEALTQGGATVSVDTRRAQVASQALAAGAHLINDVSAGADPQMLEVVAGSDAAYCLMHMQGTPQTMQKAPAYDEVVDDIYRYLAERVNACVAAGVPESRLLVDPGFGFGKTLSHNLALLQNLSRFRSLGCGVLAGISRKSMLGQITGREVHEREAASLAAAVIALERGAHILRVHDTGATMDAVRVWCAERGIERH